MLSIFVQTNLKFVPFANKILEFPKGFFFKKNKEKKRNEVV